MSDGLAEEVAERDLHQHLEKFEYVFEVTAGKGREHYMQRAALEFPTLTRVQIDLLDRFV